MAPTAAMLLLPQYYGRSSMTLPPSSPPQTTYFGMKASSLKYWITNYIQSRNQKPPDSHS